jgi:single-stranded-DNA-specific exonuclease
LVQSVYMFPLHAPLDTSVRSELSSFDDLVSALLSRRGIATKEEAEKFLNPSYEKDLHDPFLMVDMEKAATRLARAIVSGEKIAIWSDYDCDGIPGGTLLHDFFKKAGADFENYVPHRHLEGYGMNEKGIEKLAESGTKLIVTVDSGITDVEPIKRANELGVEVIVTDHHLPSEKGLPPAFAVLNPNARADETYPFKSLCGSAVAWKLVCATLAIEPKLREKVPLGWEKWLLDMVGLATIADMVPLLGENRVLATFGLLVMRKSPRLGLQKLCRGMGTNQRFLTEDDIGFMVGPRINAASRMGDANDALKLFTTSDESEAEALAKKLEKANRSRKAEAGAITRAVHTRLKDRPVRSVIALGDPEWRPALLGLVANSIADEYERPVFLWGREGNMSLKGSVRSGGRTHIVELMQETKGTFVEFGGHEKAGGFTVRDTEVFYLEDRLVEAHMRIGVAEDGDLSMYADALLTPEEATIEFLKKMERLAPFGVGNPKPVFLFKDVFVKSISRFGKAEEHLKLKINSPLAFGSDIDAVMFFAKGPVARVASELAVGTGANLLAHLERDTFSKGAPVRLRLLDLRAV